MDIYKLTSSQEIEKKPTRKRVGRGSGSGYGKTCGRGHKGQGSRSGYSQRFYFEGGQMPIVRRIPKRGFNNKWRKEIFVVNVDVLDGFEDGTKVTPEVLVETGLIRAIGDGVKILGRGELKTKLDVEAHNFSKGAREKIEAAGGTVTELPPLRPVPKKTKLARKAREARKKARKFEKLREDIMKKRAKENKARREARAKTKGRKGAGKTKDEGQGGKGKKKKGKK